MGLFSWFRSRRSLKFTQAEIAYKEEQWDRLNNGQWGIIGREIRKLSKDQQAKFKAKVFAELAERILFARTVGTSPKQIDAERLAEENARLQHRHELLKDGVPMSREEFARIVPPLLLRYSTSSVGYGPADLELLYRYSGGDPNERHAAREQLVWRHHDLILTIASSLRKNYEVLSAARQLGETTRIILSRKHCCLDVLDGCVVAPENLLRAYREPNGGFPLLPPIGTPCMERDGASCLCSIHVMTTGGRQPETLPENWREVLTKRRKDELWQRRNQAVEASAEAIAAAAKMAASIDAPPTINELAHLHISELRQIQKKYGVLGHRTKDAISRQLISTRAAQGDALKIVQKWRQDRLEQLRKVAQDCQSHIQWIDGQLAADSSATTRAP